LWQSLKQNHSKHVLGQSRSAFERRTPASAWRRRATTSEMAPLVICPFRQAPAVYATRVNLAGQVFDLLTQRVRACSGAGAECCTHRRRSHAVEKTIASTSSPRCRSHSDKGVVIDAWARLALRKSSCLRSRLASWCQRRYLSEVRRGHCRPGCRGLICSGCDGKNESGLKRHL